MRIFTRYILREVTSYALLGGVLFTFVLFMRDLDKILDLLVRDSASLTDALRIFGDMLPNTLTVTIPTAVLAGILLGLSRLAADSEVTAMRACGIGAFRFVRIVSGPHFPAPNQARPQDLLGARLAERLHRRPTDRRRGPRSPPTAASAPARHRFRAQRPRSHGRTGPPRTHPRAVQSVARSVV